MKNLTKKFTNIDNFGENISINYKGNSEYKTVLGAIFTLLLYVFITIITFWGIIEVFEYQDPQISQYTLYDLRNDNTEYNLEEH